MGCQWNDLAAKKSMACCRVLTVASTARGSIPYLAAVPETRLFCRSLGGKSTAVEIGAPTGGKVGMSVRGALRVRTYSNVGAWAMRLLDNIFSGEIPCQFECGQN